MTCFQFEWTDCATTDALCFWINVSWEKRTEEFIEFVDLIVGPSSAYSPILGHVIRSIRPNVLLGTTRAHQPLNKLMFYS